MMTFSEKLVVLRKIKHLTQDEFASAVGVSRQAVYKWESGQSYPEVQKLREMKMLFNISIDDLLDDTFEIELPKKKRRKRKPKTDNPEVAAVEEKEEEKIVFVKKEEEPALAEAPAKVENAPETEPEAPVEKVEEPALVVEEEPVAKEEVAVEEAPVIEDADLPEIKAPEINFSAEMPKVKGPAPKEINDPTQNFAKRGGLFSKIFGKK